MLARTHDIGAFATLLTAVVFFEPKGISLATAGVGLVANIVGALLPDIDQESNRLWDMLPGGNLVGRVLRNLFLGHRTLSHSILGMVVAYKIISWLIPKILNGNYIDIRLVLISLMLGYGSHLFLDGLTEEGLPLFFPLKWKIGFPPFKRWRMSTGHFLEKWIVFPTIVGYILWLGVTNWQVILGTVTK